MEDVSRTQLHGGEKNCQKEKHMVVQRDVCRRSIIKNLCDTRHIGKKKNDDALKVTIKVTINIIIIIILFIIIIIVTIIILQIIKRKRLRQQIKKNMLYILIIVERKAG